MQWRKASSGLQLTREYIDVWCTRLELPEAQVREFADMLSKEESDRAGRFKFPDKYREYVVTRGLLRSVLALVLDADPDSFQFAYTEHKKPYLRETEVSFNVSHSHDYALVALGLNRNIGVDVEKIRDKVEYEKLAKRFFSAAEHEAMVQAPEQDRKRIFYAIWTRKEAFVKATGKGIAFGLSEFDVSIHPEEPAALVNTRWDPGVIAQWHMENIEVEENYLAALAADGNPFTLRCWTL